MRALAGQFVRFGAVGVVGFAVDVLVLRAALSLLGAGPYAGRVLSYLAAATTTWALNRRFTFRDARDGRAARQWARFLAVNALGGAANYAVYAALVAAVPLCRAHPELAVAAGSLAGLALNFGASRRLVFRPRDSGAAAP